MYKVYSPFCLQTQTMFLSRGYKIAHNVYDSDIVCLPGGSDIHPSYYGQYKQSGIIYHIDAESDQREDELILEARNQKKFLFGVCKGMQWLAIKSRYRLIPEISELHKMNSLHELVTSSGTRVLTNNVHHQAIEFRGSVGYSAPHMDILAESNDGIIEAAYFPLVLGLGVQFHPEQYSPTQESIDYTFQMIEKYIGETHVQ